MVETMIDEVVVQSKSQTGVESKADKRLKLTETELVDEYGTAVYRFCRSITCTKEDAEDLYQDTFLSVFSHMQKLWAVDNQKGFLLSTAAYQWKSRRRKYARRYRLAPEIEINEDIDAIAEMGGVEDEYVTMEERLVVRALVDALPFKLKIPVILHYTNEMKVADIAAALGVPVGTVMSRLSRARAIIRKGLVSNYGY